MSFIRFWGPVLLYMGLIFWSSSRARPDVLSAAPDYLLHGLAYSGLGFLEKNLTAEARRSRRIFPCREKPLTSPLRSLRLCGEIVGAALGGAFLAAVSAVKGIAGENR